MFHQPDLIITGLQVALWCILRQINVALFQAAQLKDGEAAAGSAAKQQEADAAESARQSAQLEQYSAELSRLQRCLQDAETRVSRV
jgi:hypothetical protein